MSNEAQMASARTAARWWADKLRTGGTFDSGDSSERGQVFASVASTFQQERVSRLTPEQIQAFEDELARRIEHLIEHAHPFTDTIIKVDYYPDELLTGVVRQTLGIEPGMTLFSCKMIMWIRPEGIEVEDGYNAPVTPVPLLQE